MVRSKYLENEYCMPPPRCVPLCVVLCTCVLCCVPVCVVLCTCECCGVHLCVVYM